MNQIKIKVPVTTNGRDPLMRNGSQVFKETIVQARARKSFEKMNTRRPDHLKYVIEDLPVAELKKTKKNDTE